MGEENCVWQLPVQQAWPSAGRHAVTTTLHWETKRVFRTEVEKTQCNKHYLEHRCLTVQQTVSSSLNSSLTFGMSSWPSGQQCLRESAFKNWANKSSFQRTPLEHSYVRMIGSFLTTWTHYHRCEGNRVTVQRSIPAFSCLIEANCVFRGQECRPLSNAPALMRFRMMSYDRSPINWWQCTSDV